MPFIIRGLGTDTFGVLSLAWLILGYFSIFNLGLGRATTKFVAECLGCGQMQRLPQLVWTSVGLQVLLGVLGGFLLMALAPLLVGKVFNIPPELIGEARIAFLILGASLPIVLGATALQGVLEAGQRFDLVNAVKIPSSSLTFLIPTAALLFDFRLPGIVLLLLIARLGAALAYLVLCIRAFPALKQAFSFDCTTVRPLFIYGGWVTVCNVVGLALVRLDRFLIGSLLSMAAVAYYTAPYEIVTRLWILPASLVMTLFPAFSTFGTSGVRRDLDRLYAHSVKYLLLIIGPIILVLVLFAENILGLWLGSDFAEKSTLVFRILAIGVLINSLAHVPYNFLQGLGHPDITARFQTLELPLYVALLWFLVKSMGIAGAALAWLLRVGLDALLLFGVSWKLLPLSPSSVNGLLRGFVTLFVLAIALQLTPLLSGTVVIQAAAVVVLVTLFALAAWCYVLDAEDKKTFTSVFCELAGAVRDVR